MIHLTERGQLSYVHMGQAHFCSLTLETLGRVELTTLLAPSGYPLLEVGKLLALLIRLIDRGSEPKESVHDEPMLEASSEILRIFMSFHNFESSWAGRMDETAEACLLVVHCRHVFKKSGFKKVQARQLQERRLLPSLGAPPSAPSIRSILLLSAAGWISSGPRFK